ncbi:MAG: hypothetical protein ABI743_05985, partial [bacterium]
SAGSDYAAITALEVGETQAFAAGRFTGTIDFDPGAGSFSQIATPSASNKGDFFVLRLNSIPGTFSTAVRWGNGEDGLTTDILFGGCSTFLLYSTGYFTGTTDFDPGTGIVNGTSAGGADAFLVQSRGDLLTF